MRALEAGLLAFGYPASIVVISRFPRVVRERRARWLAVHHLGMLAIVAGWVSRGRPSAAAVNGAWLLASSAWYVRGGRHGHGAEGAGAGR